MGAPAVILGIAAAATGNAASVLWGTAIFRHVRTGSDVDWALFLALRLTLISASVAVAGLLGFLTPLGLGTVSALALVAFRLTRADRPWPSFPRIDAGRVSLLLTALVAIRLLWQVAAFSPHVVDALTYHLPKIAEWVRAGRFTREMGLDERAAFPAGFELVETWWVVFFRHDALVEMAGLEFLALSMASVYSLARSLGVGGRFAYLAGLLFILTPGIYFQATSCLNDGPVAAVVLTVAAFILARVPFPLLVWTVALGAGIKPTFAYTVPGLALLWLLTPREEAQRRPPSRAGIGLAAAGIALGAFWYVRNALWFGSPIYPMGPGGFAGPTGRASQQLGPSLKSLSENFTCLMEVRIRDGAAAYGSMLNSIAGWGGIAVACGLPALVPALREDARWRRLAGAFLASMACVFLLVHLDLWYLRFVLFFPAILAMAVARLAESWKGFLPVCGLALALQLASTFVPKEYEERPTIAPSLNLAPGEPVACFGDRDGRAYLLYGHDFSRPIHYLRAGTPQELVEQVEKSGARILLASPVRRREQDVLEEGVRLGGFRKLDPFFYVVSR